MLKNQNPQRIYVLQSRNALEKLASVTHCGYGAGTVLLFTYNTDEEWKNPLEEGIHSGIEDVSIAASFMMMEAADLGLDTCWCNYFPNAKLEKLFSLPEKEKSVLIMPVGYKADDAVLSPAHAAKKARENMVRNL